MFLQTVFAKEEQTFVSLMHSLISSHLPATFLYPHGQLQEYPPSKLRQVLSEEHMPGTIHSSISVQTPEFIMWLGGHDKSLEDKDVTPLGRVVLSALLFAVVVGNVAADAFVVRNVTVDACVVRNVPLDACVVGNVTVDAYVVGNVTVDACVIGNVALDSRVVSNVAVGSFVVGNVEVEAAVPVVNGTFLMVAMVASNVPVVKLFSLAMDDVAMVPFDSAVVGNIPLVRMVALVVSDVSVTIGAFGSVSVNAVVFVDLAIYGSDIMVSFIIRDIPVFSIVSVPVDKE